LTAGRRQCQTSSHGLVLPPSSCAVTPNPLGFSFIVGGSVQPCSGLYAFGARAPLVPWRRDGALVFFIYSLFFLPRCTQKDGKKTLRCTCAKASTCVLNLFPTQFVERQQIVNSRHIVNAQLGSKISNYYFILCIICHIKNFEYFDFTKINSGI
jgi:hypothetical protein